MVGADQWEAGPAHPWCCGGIINTGDGTHRALAVVGDVLCAVLLLAPARPPLLLSADGVVSAQ